MRRIELYWNIVHYFVWKADYRVHLFFNKINPFMLIHKLPFQKRMYERRGINIYDEINTSFKDPKSGLSSIRAGGFMFILSLLISVAFFCLIQSIHTSGYLNPVFIIIIAIPFAILNYFLLLYKDKYLDYFKQFEVKPKDWKRKWGWISLGIILTIFFTLFICFKTMDYSLHN